MHTHTHTQNINKEIVFFVVVGENKKTKKIIVYAIAHTHTHTVHNPIVCLIVTNVRNRENIVEVGTHWNRAYDIGLEHMTITSSGCVVQEPKHKGPRPAHAHICAVMFHFKGFATQTILVWWGTGAWPGTHTHTCRNDCAPPCACTQTS